MTKNIISENTVTLISDYLTQFLLISSKNPFLKHQILNTDVKKSLEILYKATFEEDLKRVGWKLILPVENPNFLFNLQTFS